MKKVLKILLYIVLVLAFLAAVLFGFRWYTSQRNAEAPITVSSDLYLTTAPEGSGNSNLAEEEQDNLASDSSIEETTWPFAESKSEAEDGFVAKKSTGYSVKKTSSKTTAATTKKSSDKTSDETTKKSSDEKTTKKSSSAKSGSAKAFLQKIQSSASKTNNGHPVKVDSNGISIEYKKFAVGDLNGDGKDEVFLYAESTKGSDFYGNSYIVYDSSFSNARTTMVVDDYEGPTFYASGVYEITKNKFGFVSDSVASSFGVKNANSILGFDTNATPYLEYKTNGPYIDAPAEISASDYNAKVKKLKAGGKVSVKVYDFTTANVDKLS